MPQTRYVHTFPDLLSVPYHGETNAICWSRDLRGDFAEIVQKLPLTEDLVVLQPGDLLALDLTEAGHTARAVILQDMKVLEAHGASPILNLIRHYERDDAYPYFPTDVYSFHVDRAPVPGHTFLCTYHGAASDLIPNEQARQKILIPEIREKLRRLYDGPEAGFDAFLTEYFFDLHYQAEPDAEIVNLGNGNLWRLAIDHPGNPVLPCIHRAPVERDGEPRLMLIC